MTGFVILLCLLLLLTLPILGLWLLCRWLRARWVDASGKGQRIAIAFVSALAISSPYLAFRSYDLYVVLSRVPDPLHVSWIEYRLESSWGIGMPGDNETGFVVYRMTSRSADWTRKQGRHLGAVLPGGSTRWRQTPIDEDGAYQEWHRYDGPSSRHRHAASLSEYLGKYGFLIPIEKGRDTEFNDAIRHSGSSYSYGPGGSVTVIDPRRGKIYFAYAG